MDNQADSDNVRLARECVRIATENCDRIRELREWLEGSTRPFVLLGESDDPSEAYETFYKGDK